LQKFLRKQGFEPFLEKKDIGKRSSLGMKHLL